MFKVGAVLALSRQGKGVRFSEILSLSVCRCLQFLTLTLLLARDFDYFLIKKE